jgi:hypothetical protein
MKRIFWFTLVLLFLLVNEYLSKFLLAVFVGHLEINSAVERTFQYSTIDSYLFSAGFRAIPFIVLGLFAAKSKLSLTSFGRVGIWIIMLLNTSFILYGYWGMQHSLFTDAHTSSTSALAILWIPIWASFFTIIGCMVLVVISKISRSFHGRA